MLRGEKILLRARYADDVPLLHRELHDDIAARVRTTDRPWRPCQVDGAASPFAPAGPTPEAAVFSVLEMPAGSDDPADGVLAGAASLWGIDQYNRGAHLGISILPSRRGRGLGTDVVRVLCEFGFTVEGLRRLQMETLEDNTAMITAATRAGFTVEGRLRRSAWVYGEFRDEVLLGLLVEEWKGGAATRA
ncbi:GNAT family N-acetyltransferase [Kitasatospora viridis]|uniref:RimJ/RimL family protein N-acetyltransferase n=1 Tax=Kitasatospora viridis TaxID=281105 RepID=A0A561T7C5_9ACTN|nr:GNAT family protein [Kitasatospora viridis]TWF83008.1 RimJ/RimL family protein N-acetyltransferase [Kitasatospora viridis]